MVYSIFLGWWGIPWGILLTPVQIGKNVVALFKSHSSVDPSAQLGQLVRIGIASQALREHDEAPS